MCLSACEKENLGSISIESRDSSWVVAQLDIFWFSRHSIWVFSGYDNENRGIVNTESSDSKRMVALLDIF